MSTPETTPIEAAAEELPRTFGRYVLFDLVGRGGMAEIFLARARTTEAGGARLVVVKQILPELSASAKFSEAFVAEAKLAARLSHANIVQVLDLGRAPSNSMPPAPLDGDGQRIPVSLTDDSLPRVANRSGDRASLVASMRPTPVAPHSRLF